MSSQQQDRSDVKMAESSYRSIPLPVPPLPLLTFNAYQINKHGIKYDPVDTRELKELFGEDLYRFFKIDKKHGQYHLSLFIMSENPIHYTWEGAVDLIEKVFETHPDGGNPKQLLNYLSGVRPRSRGGYAVSCTYSFTESIENPCGALELYYGIDSYMANNKKICNYIGSDKDDSRCHFYTNKNQVYHHKYLIFNIPLNITGLGIYDINNSIKTTKFILDKIAPISKVGQIRWERAKNQRSGLISETIELQTFDPIKIENKQVKELEIKFLASGYEVNRVIKIVKRKERYGKQLDSYKVYDPDQMKTKFMALREQFEADKEESKQQQQQQRANAANQRMIANQPQNIRSAFNNALGAIINSNNNNNNNNNTQQQLSTAPIDTEMSGGESN